MLITVEGGEGSGKGTQLKNIAAWLAGNGKDFLLTREPGGCRIGCELRKILLHVDNVGLSPAAELFLYLADRAQHVEEIVRPALKAGKVVVSDRFFDSTIAYQGAGRSVLPPKDLMDLNLLATGGLVPDMTILLDVPVGVGLSRAVGRNEADGKSREEGRFEAEEKAFHETVRQGFLSLASSYPERFVVIDAGRSVSDVGEDVIRALESAFCRQACPMRGMP